MSSDKLFNTHVHETPCTSNEMILKKVDGDIILLIETQSLSRVIVILCLRGDLPRHCTVFVYTALTRGSTAGGTELVTPSLSKGVSTKSYGQGLTEIEGGRTSNEICCFSIIVLTCWFIGVVRCVIKCCCMRW